MLRTSLIIASLVALAAHAQDVSSPPVVAAEEDRTVVMTDDDELLFGAARQKVTPVELFRALGRTDLVERSAQNAQRRLVFGVTGAAVAVVGIGVGVGLLATTPDLTTGPCSYDIALYNTKCRSEASLHQVAGAATLGSAVLLAGIFASLALWSRPEVFTRAELRQFVEEQKGTAPPPSPPVVQLLPAVGPGFSGLVASGAF